MTYMIEPYFTGFMLSAALIIAIGAQNLFVLRQGLRQEHIGYIILFCGCADATLITLGVSGVGAFLASVPELFKLLTYGGAAFLTGYGLLAFRRSFRSESLIVTEGGGISLKYALSSAAAFTFLNPHMYLDTVLLMGVAGSAQPEETRSIFVAGAVTASFVWFTCLGYGARLLAPLFAKPIAWRILDGLVGILMLTIAVLLLTQEAPTP